MREITHGQLWDILEVHKKWAESDGKEGVKANLRNTNLSEADLRRANLSNADLSGANLSRVYLSKANLRNADLRDADLSEAYISKANLKGADLSSVDLCNAILSGANLSNVSLRNASLSHADLRDANLSDTDLSGANLSGVDLSSAFLHGTHLREEDLIGVKYRPEQLKDMIIERPEREPTMAPEEKGTLTIRFVGENPPLLHFIYLSAFLEYQYDIFYIFLFSQYESIGKLRDILMGSPFHWLKDKDEAVKIVRMSTQSPPTIEFLGKFPIFVFIYGLYLATPKGIKDDIYRCIRQAIWKTKKEKLEEELLQAEVLMKNAEAFKACRDIGVAPADIITPGMGKETLPQAFHPEGASKLARTIEGQKDDITTRPPRIDYYKTVLLLRQEGMLTNKLDDKALANLLEIIIEKAIQDHQSILRLI
jgi:hypothetical protein